MNSNSSQRGNILQIVARLTSAMTTATMNWLRLYLVPGNTNGHVSSVARNFSNEGEKVKLTVRLLIRRIERQFLKNGLVVQWLERTPDKREVVGSTPTEPTNLRNTAQLRLTKQSDLSGLTPNLLQDDQKDTKGDTKVAAVSALTGCFFVCLPQKGRGYHIITDNANEPQSLLTVSYKSLLTLPEYVVEVCPLC